MSIFMVKFRNFIEYFGYLIFITIFVSLNNMYYGRLFKNDTENE
jgi:hypothetical protein